MSEKIFDIIYTLFILFIILIGILFLIELEDFYEDYKCSTTTSIDYYNEHNCVRFER